MKKTAVALVAAASCIVGGVSVPQVADAQGMTLAQVYQPGIGWADDVGTAPKLGFVLLGETGSWITGVEYKFGTLPYPGINITDPFSTYPDYVKRLNFSLTGGQIYPAEFTIPITVKVTYEDGSWEYINGDYRIRPLKTLVSGTPAEPVVTNPTPTVTVTKTTTATATVTETAEPAPTTVTKTQAPVTTTTTVTAPPTTVTKEPAPATVTTTATTTVTTTVKAAPVTTTVSGAPVTATTTVTPETTTVTKTVEPKPSQGQDSGSSSGGVWAAVLAILAAIGGGAYWWYFNMR